MLLLPKGEVSHRKICWLSFIIVLEVAVWTSSFGTAAADDDPAEVRIAPHLRMTAQRFDEVMFPGGVRVSEENGRLTGAKDRFRPSLEAAYVEEIERLANEFDLSDRQKKKIHLAARGDVVRLMNRIDVIRQKCTSPELSQAEYSSLVAEMQALTYAPRLMFTRPSSLFRKTLRGCLTAEQMLLYPAAEHNRQVAMLERVLDQIDNTRSNRVSLKLTPEVRRKFIQIMLANAKLPPASHPYATQIVFLEAAKQEERLSAVFTQSQWENFQNQLKNARQVEATFKGVWRLLAWEEDPGLSEGDWD